jgi:rhomboid protease GluP
MEDHNVSPFNALPPVVVALAVVIAGLGGDVPAGDGSGFWAGRAASAGGLRQCRITRCSMRSRIGCWPMGRFPPEQLLRFLTYPLIHGGFVHAAFVVVFILAIGKMVAEVFSPLAFIAIFWVSAVFGALAYVLLLDSPFPLIGRLPRGLRPDRGVHLPDVGRCRACAARASCAPSG